jgi:predicted nucleic acid-binding protein
VAARAIIHSGRDTFPTLLTLDTCLIVAAVDSTDPHHRSAHAVYERAAQKGTVVAICRPLLTLEIRHALTKIANDRSPAALGSILDQATDRVSAQIPLFRAPRPANNGQAKRRYFVPAGEQIIESYLSALSLVRIRMTEALVMDSQRHVVNLGLGSSDAVMLSTAEEAARAAGVPVHMGSTDKDFERVPRLHLWGRR